NRLTDRMHGSVGEAELHHARMMAAVLPPSRAGGVLIPDAPDRRMPRRPHPRVRRLVAAVIGSHIESPASPFTKEQGVRRTIAHVAKRVLRARAEGSFEFVPITFDVAEDARGGKVVRPPELTTAFQIAKEE